MNTLRSFLSKPFPFIGGVRRDIWSNLLIGTFVFLFLTIFQPFQINLWHTPYKLLKLAGFGFVSFAVPTCINLFLTTSLRGSSFLENWTVLKEICSLLVVLLGVAFGNMVYGHLLGVMPFGFFAYLIVFGITCTIGVFPVTLHVVLKHNKLLHMNLEQSKLINQHLSESSKPQPGLQVPATLKLVAENEKDVLEIPVAELLYIESADNYSNIYTRPTDQLQRHILRSSLKRLENQVSLPGIVRCHRSYIVNLGKVKHVEGNAAGYRLYFDLPDVSVPVSRAYVQVVNEGLNRA